MKPSTLSAVIGLAFLSMSLIFIQSSASYSAGADEPGADVAKRETGQASPSRGRITIPANALPPFDPGSTRTTEADGALIVYLEAGNTRQALHIVPEYEGRTLDAVQVFHAEHGRLMSLKLEAPCKLDSAARETATSGALPRMAACGRYAA